MRSNITSIGQPGRSNDCRGVVAVILRKLLFFALRKSRNRARCSNRIKRYSRNSSTSSATSSRKRKRRRMSICAASRPSLSVIAAAMRIRTTSGQKWQSTISTIGSTRARNGPYNRLNWLRSSMRRGKIRFQRQSVSVCSRGAKEISLWSRMAA